MGNSMSKFEGKLKGQEEDLSNLRTACEEFQKKMNGELRKVKSPNKNQPALMASNSQQLAIANHHQQVSPSISQPNLQTPQDALNRGYQNSNNSNNQYQNNGSNPAGFFGNQQQSNMPNNGNMGGMHQMVETEKTRTYIRGPVQQAPGQ